MKVARAAGIVSTIAAIVVIAGVFSRIDLLAYTAAIVVLVAGVLVVLASRETVHQRTTEATEAPAVAEPAKKAEPIGSVLLATLRNAEEGSERLLADLHRVLAGIVADERGKIDRVEPHSIVALFNRGEHAAAAVHAARRMLSNVDALSRRLGQPLAISIAVHTGPRGDESVNVAARIQEAATDSVPVLVSAPAAKVLGSELEQVDTVAADGWSLDVFTFPPAQKRLPGF
ncbi:MAG TPA: hypothetical protein VF057_03780 [Thermoanaerobaculia bacterium]